MGWNLVFLLAAEQSLMFLEPGPDRKSSSRAVSQGMRHALIATLGLLSAGFVFVPAIALGLNFINTSSPSGALRATGALYLIIVGFRMVQAVFTKRGKHKFAR